MLQPVLDPVLSREILARYTTFASSVGAPAPMEHLASAPGSAPARYETYVENLYEVTNLLRKNTVLNLQWDLRFVALRLADAIQQADRTQTRRLRMLERQVTLLQNEAGRLQAAARQPQPSGTAASAVPRTNRGLTAVHDARQAALAPLPVMEPAPPAPAPTARVLAQPGPANRPESTLTTTPAPRRPIPEQAAGKSPVQPQPGEQPAAGKSAAARESAPRTEATARPRPVRPDPAAPASADPAHLSSRTVLPIPATESSAAREPKAAVSTTVREPARQAPAPAARVLAKPMAAETPVSSSLPAAGQQSVPPGRTSAENVANRSRTAGNQVPIAPRSGQNPAVSVVPTAAPSGRAAAPPTAGPMVRSPYPLPGNTATMQQQEAVSSPVSASPMTARQKTRPARMPLGHIEPAEGEAEQAPLSDPRPGRLQRPAPSSRVLRQDPPGRASQRQQIQSAVNPTAAPESAGVAATPDPTVPPAGHTGHAARSAAESSEKSFPRQEQPAPAAVRPTVQPEIPAAPSVPPEQAAAAPVLRREPKAVQPVAKVYADPAAARSEEATAASPVRRPPAEVRQNLPSAAPGIAPAALAPSVGNSDGKPAPAAENPTARTVVSDPTGQSPLTARRTPPSAVPVQRVYPVVPGPPATEAGNLPASSASAEPRAVPAAAGMQKGTFPGHPAASAREFSRTVRGHAASAARTSPARSSAQGAAAGNGKAAAAVISPPLSPATPAPIVYGIGPAASSESRTPPQTAAPAAWVPKPEPGVAASWQHSAGPLPLSRTADPSRTRLAFAAVPKIAAFVPASYRTALSEEIFLPKKVSPGPGAEGSPRPAGSAVLTWAVPDSPAGTAGTSAPQGGAPGPVPRKTPDAPVSAAPRQAPPAGSPAPMELRRVPAPEVSEPAPPASWGSGDIQTVRRTRTQHRETHQETPSTVTVHLPDQPAARTVPAVFGPAEVERLAEKVYRQIEERLRSEKMRRGM